MRRTPHRDVAPGNLRPMGEGPAAPRWWSLLLDGAHPWGSFDVVVSQYGVRRYRLTIYPPTATRADQRLARLWRAWPISGVAAALLAVMLFGNVTGSPDTVLAFAVAAYVTIGALLFLRAGPARVQVRSASIILLPETADVAERRRYAGCRALVEMLTQAGQLLTVGDISSVEHEAIWWEAYDRLGDIARE